MQIMERFNAEGIDFAFPSQTLYLAGDSKRPINLGQPSSPMQSAAGMSSRPGTTARTTQDGTDLPGTAG